VKREKRGATDAGATVPEAITRANDTQVGGGHYKARAIEPWDVVALLGLDPFQADIMYYLIRWKEKNGLEDLEKALHWLQKYVEVERLRKSKGDYGMRATLLEAAAQKARAKADEVDKDAGFYATRINALQVQAFSDMQHALRRWARRHGTDAAGHAVVAVPKKRRRAKK
jgi:hypothetical protein